MQLGILVPERQRLGANRAKAAASTARTLRCERPVTPKPDRAKAEASHEASP
jgi:hypothetical protein